MFCVHCGNALPDEGSFCPHCGAVRTDTPIEGPKSEPKDEKQSKTKPQKKRTQFSKTPLFARIKKLPKPVLALIFVALIAVSIFLIEFILVNRKIKCPDPYTFFSLSEKETQYYWQYHGSYDYFFDKTYPGSIDAETAWDALKEYRVLLEEYGAEVSLEDETDSQYNRYSMEADFGQAAIFDNSHLKLTVIYYPPEERWFFNRWGSADNFTFVPAGTYSGAESSAADADSVAEPDTSPTLSPEPEPAPVPEPIPEPEPAPQPEDDSDDTSSGYVDCPSCYGGNCTACNGRKGSYSYSPGLPREWDPCWKCHGDGDCSRCGGFGQIFG